MLPDEYKTMFYAEENYWWYVGLHDLIVNIIKKHFNDKNISILDAGCGTCRLMQLLNDEGYNTEGFDYSQIALKFCLQRNIKNIYFADINNWQPQKKYDVIISADVICSIGIIDDQKIINKFHKALNHNGLLILNLPAFEILRRNHDKAVFIRKRYTKKHVYKLLKNANFSINFITYRLPWLFFIIFFKKIYQKIFNITNSKSDLKQLPKFLNNSFLVLNKFDNFLVHNKIKNFVGSSVFSVSQK